MPPAPAVVLDTSVVSMLLRDTAQSAFYRDEIAGHRAVISFQTLEESWFGAARANWGAQRRNALAQHLRQFEVVWPTAEMVDLSVTLRIARERAGRRIATSDAWVAATAIMLGCPLASHDRDFAGIAGLELIRYAPNP